MQHVGKIFQNFILERVKEIPPTKSLTNRASNQIRIERVTLDSSPDRAVSKRESEPRDPSPP